MSSFEERPRLGYRGSVGSRANAVVMKTLAVITGGVVLASAFLLSLVFFAVAFAVVVIGGGYLWWKTRELRKRMRAQMEAAQVRHPQGTAFTGNVIEGVDRLAVTPVARSRRPR